MLFQEVQSQEKEYLMSTYNRFPVALASGSGAKAVDTEGKEYRFRQRHRREFARLLRPAVGEGGFGAGRDAAAHLKLILQPRQHSARRAAVQGQRIL